MLHNLGITLNFLVFAYFSFLAGEILLERVFRIEFPTKRESFLYKMLSGYALFSLIGLALAGLHIFNQLALFTSVIIILLLASHAITRHLNAFISIFREQGKLRTTVENLFPRPRFFTILIIIWIFANFIIAFVPLTGHDTLDYHFPIIQNIIAEERLTFTETIGAYSYFPVLGEIIYAVPTALFGETSAPFVFQLLQFSILILFAVLVYDFTKKYTHRKTFPFLAVIGLLAIMPFEREIMHGGYVDVLVFIFALASFLIAIQYAFGKTSPRLIFFASFLIAIAASIKYTALFFLPFVFTLFFIGLWRLNRSPKSILKHLAIGVIIFCAVISPWYVKNALQFGNPVFPLFSNSEFKEQVGLFMPIERTVVNMTIFPFYRFSQYFFQSNVSSGDLVVLGYFISMFLLALFLLLFSRRRIAARDIVIFLTIEAYMSYMFFMSHQIRFMLPALILLPIIIALLADKVFDEMVMRWPKLQAKLPVTFSFILIGAICIFLFLGNIHYFKIKNYYIFGKYNTQEYIIVIGGQ